MVCAHGKQNSHIGNFHLGWPVPFEQQTQLTERALGDFDIFKMAAEIVVFYEIIDMMLQLTRNYFSQLLDYEEDGEFHLI